MPWRRTLLALLYVGMLAALGGGLPAKAQTERDLQRRFCAGMLQEYAMPDGTRADCVSATHVIEVDFSSKWAEAIGQSLHYALWTREIRLGPRKAGIILM